MRLSELKERIQTNKHFEALIRQYGPFHMGFLLKLTGNRATADACFEAIWLKLYLHFDQLDTYLAPLFRISKEVLDDNQARFTSNLTEPLSTVALEILQAPEDHINAIFKMVIDHYINGKSQYATYTEEDGTDMHEVDTVLSLFRPDESLHLDEILTFTKHKKPKGIFLFVAICIILSVFYLASQNTSTPNTSEDTTSPVPEDSADALVHESPVVKATIQLVSTRTVDHNLVFEYILAHEGKVLEEEYVVEAFLWNNRTRYTLKYADGRYFLYIPFVEDKMESFYLSINVTAFSEDRMIAEQYYEIGSSEYLPEAEHHNLNQKIDIGATTILVKSIQRQGPYFEITFHDLTSNSYDLPIYDCHLIDSLGRRYEINDYNTVALGFQLEFEPLYDYNDIEYVDIVFTGVNHTSIQELGTVETQGLEFEYNGKSYTFKALYDPNFSLSLSTDSPINYKDYPDLLIKMDQSWHKLVQNTIPARIEINYNTLVNMTPAGNSDIIYEYYHDRYGIDLVMTQIEKRLDSFQHSKLMEMTFFDYYTDTLTYYTYMVDPNVTLTLGMVGEEMRETVSKSIRFIFDDKNKEFLDN